jgi:signal transduction histidine kinase
MPPIQRSLSNLITNAITYTEKGSVTVEWSRIITEDSDVTRLSVVDTGIGMNEQELDRVFQGFEQIAYDGSEHDNPGEPTPTAHTKPGLEMGLGLASVCKLIL